MHTPVTDRECLLPFGVSINSRFGETSLVMIYSMHFWIIQAKTPFQTGIVVLPEAGLLPAVAPPVGGLLPAVVLPEAGLLPAVVPPKAGLLPAVVPPKAGLLPAVVPPAGGLTLAPPPPAVVGLRFAPTVNRTKILTVNSKACIHMRSD